MYFEPGRTSTMELLLKSFKLLTIFTKNLQRICSTGLKIDIWLGFEILTSVLLPVYKLSRENTLPENMCNNVFEKAKRRAGKVNAEAFTRVYVGAAVRRVL